jgi:hypothetical protein
MLDLMSLEDRIDARAALILRRRIKTADDDALEDLENELRDLMSGRIPREIWQQRFLKQGSTLLSPVGRFSIDTLDRTLSQRSKRIQGAKDGPNAFPLRKLIESWLASNMVELRHNHVQAGGKESDLESQDGMDQRRFLHMDVATSNKDSLLRWLDPRTLGSREVRILVVDSQSLSDCVFKGLTHLL